MSELAPIVLFTYNRPWHTQQTIEALQNNELAQESDLYIYSDGAKLEKDKALVSEVRSYLKTVVGFKTIKIIEQKDNQGLAQSIITGVTKIVNQYGRVIVLEDDIVTSPYFLAYMNGALDFYEKDNKVMHISSYIFPMNTEGLGEFFFLEQSTCWGWATWDTSWKHFEKNPQNLIQRYDKKMIKAFNLDGTHNYWRQVIGNATGEMNTWAIFWATSIANDKGLCLHPKESFSQNIGADGSGQHVSESNLFDVMLAKSYVNQFPKEVSLSFGARENLKVYFKKMKRGRFSVKRIAAFINRNFK